MFDEHIDFSGKNLTTSTYSRANDSFYNFIKDSNSFVDKSLTLEDLKNTVTDNDYKTRLIYEFTELFIRARKLHEFILNIKFGKVDANYIDCSIFLLEKQLDVMVEYLKILEIRCKSSNISLLLFKAKDDKKVESETDSNKKVLEVMGPDNQTKKLTKDDFMKYYAVSVKDFKSTIKNDPDLKYVYIALLNDGGLQPLVVWKYNKCLVEFPFEYKYIKEFFSK